MRMKPSIEQPPWHHKEMRGDMESPRHHGKSNQEGHIWGSMRRTALILGSGLLLSLAFWNSVTWCCTGAWALLLGLQWPPAGGGHHRETHLHLPLPHPTGQERAGGPREAASVYPHSCLQPDYDLSSHAGHLLPFLQVEGRPLLPRPAHLPLVPRGAGPFHPRGGNPVLLLTPVSNMLPVMVGPLAMGSHLSSITVWLSLALIITTISHCGYHLPFLPSPEFHDYHHLKFNQCYGVLGVLDHLHGTDIMFKQTKAYERHVLLLGFTPLSESIPDPPKKMESSSLLGPSRVFPHK
ncbi:fatty acid hydroxylase domain-containing protein 2-like isoform X4 [Peromyscus californicus insignis]|uniref:fatty acid hydroxylase domain-containing protein 2-like isoform X4 n=1 Tax=Peromyscus californicus insignis TaxID=564181 RepID=UPI0022A77418|nr:fatty acid hydroxylase domain-containing protein 2-like isoform X4 [Peromyscus californicus insignis]